MTKIILKTIIIMLILAGFFSCGNNEFILLDNANNESVSLGNVNNEPISLKDTKWKLAGFVDVQTGVLEEIVPKKGHLDENDILTDGDPIECTKCYTFTFVTDNEAQGWSVANELRISFFDSFQNSSTNISFSKTPLCGGTKIGESVTPTRYVRALQQLTSNIYSNDEIKLFYNNNENYLLYKLVSCSEDENEKR
jgi:hypothetical protein